MVIYSSFVGMMVIVYIIDIYFYAFSDELTVTILDKIRTCLYGEKIVF